MTRFKPRSDDDIVTLLDENALTWIFFSDEIGPFATAAPVRPVVVGGRLQRLVGHVPRGCRVAKCLESPQEALILALGPHSYISPSWMSDRAQAPTWNFASAQLLADVELVDDPAFLKAHLCDLVAATERNRRQAWHIDELGARMQKLASRIIAFEGRILSMNGRFKLGQDENDETYREIVRELDQTGLQQLTRWMRRFDGGRR